MSPTSDNSTQTGADTIATDDVTTLNGAGSTGVKVQRVKVGYGDDGSHRDASAAFPLPVVQTGALPAGTNAIGAITGTGTAGTPAAGVQTVQGITGATAVPVSGTFWQATQPVSLATAPTTPVTGTFWQATQPVSLATNAPDVTDRATRVLGLLATGTNSIGTVQQATITKGTQGATGVTTQDLKDAGRASVYYYTLIPVLATATDTLQSLTGTKGGATVAATATPAVVTAGKTFRIQRFHATYIATATAGYGVVRLRYNTAGAVAIASPVLATMAVGTGTPATANATDSEEAPLPDGIEVPAGTGIGISVQGFAAATATAVGYILCGVSGYEY